MLAYTYNLLILDFFIFTEVALRCFLVQCVARCCALLDGLGMMFNFPGVCQNQPTFSIGINNHNTVLEQVNLGKFSTVTMPKCYIKTIGYNNNKN